LAQAVVGHFPRGSISCQPVAAMNASAVFFVVCLLVFGALNTLSTKLTFQMKAMDLDGHMQTFQKQWFGVYRMFQGMAFVMFFHFYNEFQNYRKRQASNGKNAANSDEMSLVPPATPLKAYFAVAVPALFDLLGTVFGYIGLFYNSPSIWQMFRGSMIVFATLFSVTFLKRKMSKLKWMGVSMCVIAVVVVGIANMLSEGEQVEKVDPELKVYGMAMIIVGMLFSGAQMVVEEYFMKGISIPPMCIVGMEGVWGVIITFVFIFPVVGRLPGDDVGGCMENLDNDIAMVNNSPELQKVVVVYLVSVFTYNIAGMMVTYALSAVHRTMLEASRTAVIWSIDLAIHSFLPNSSFGEAWNSWSFLQLLGFVLLILGQATYGELITWGRGASWKSIPAMGGAEPLILSPDARSALASPKSPWSGGSSMRSPNAIMGLPVDMPDDGTDLVVEQDEEDGAR